METKVMLQDLNNKIDKLWEYLGIDNKKQDLQKVEGILQNNELWSQQDEMRKYTKRKATLEKTISDISEAKIKIQDTIDLFNLAEKENDSGILEEINVSLQNLGEEISILELTSTFNDKEDKMGCFLEINAGAGGTDSQDLASQMVRMYTMWAVKRGYKVRTVDTYIGDDAGIKQAILEIEGDLAFGYLKNENGVHRFVRISPFNANGKRQTSFISVFVYPIVEDESGGVEITDKDLRIETYRSSGAGGQHVNTTDSAVRVTHIPTNLVAQCQSQRSQLQNKNEAMKMLRSRLMEYEIKKANQQRMEIEAGKSDISWGHQVRNYVFHPYKMVKDLRSGYETSKTESVMNGDLDQIINSLLVINKSNSSAKQ